MRPRTWEPLWPQRAGVVPACTVLRAASPEATATMAATRLIREAFAAAESAQLKNAATFVAPGPRCAEGRVVPARAFN